MNEKPRMKLLALSLEGNSGLDEEQTSNPAAGFKIL